MENNSIHECSSHKDNIKEKSENKSQSIQNSFEINNPSIRNPIGNNNSSSLVSKVYTHTPSRKSQEDDFLDSQQNNIGFHEIKETIDQKKKGKLLKLNPIDAKNAKFPSTDADKFAKLMNKIDEYIDCQNKTNEIQHETNEIQRETNKRILLYLENQDKLNIEMYNHLQNK